MRIRGCGDTKKKLSDSNPERLRVRHMNQTLVFLNSYSEDFTANLVY